MELRRLVSLVLVLFVALLPAAAWAEDEGETEKKKKVRTSKKLHNDHFRQAELMEPTAFVELQAPIEQSRRELLDSQARAKTAKSELQAAKDLLSVEEIEETAAKWELKAAKAKADSKRIRRAEERMKQTGLALDVARSMVKWRKERLKACKADVKRNDAAIDQHEAERDLRAVELLHAYGSLEAERYETRTFQTKASSRVASYEKARRKADEAWSRTDRLERDYARLARKQGNEVELIGRNVRRPEVVPTSVETVPLREEEIFTEDETVQALETDGRR